LIKGIHVEMRINASRCRARHSHAIDDAVVIQLVAEHNRLGCDQ